MDARGSAIRVWCARYEDGQMCHAWRRHDQRDPPPLLPSHFLPGSLQAFFLDRPSFFIHWPLRYFFLSPFLSTLLFPSAIPGLPRQYP